jgi:hypothetical protein
MKTGFALQFLLGEDSQSRSNSSTQQYILAADYLQMWMPVEIMLTLPAIRRRLVVESPTVSVIPLCLNSCRDALAKQLEVFDEAMMFEIAWTIVRLQHEVLLLTSSRERYSDRQATNVTFGASPITNRLADNAWVSFATFRGQRTF